MEDVEMREDLTEAAVGAEVRDDGLWLGDAIDFFLSAKRAGGRSEKTVDDYRKKLEIFQRWLAIRVEGEDAVDAPYIGIGPTRSSPTSCISRTGAGWPTPPGRTTSPF